MLVFIDESGDPGFKLDKGSTSHFVVAMVIFHDENEVEQCSLAISTLRTKLGFRSEFKFNNSSHRIKDDFFSSIAPFSFEIWALVVQKRIIYSPALINDDEKFYNYFVKSLISYGAKLKNAKIKIDGSGNRNFRSHLEKYLKRELPKEAIKSVKFANSQNNNLIQLADMVAGAIARSYKADKADAKRWRTMLESKIENCWEFK
jgi:hypothetical protein